MSENIFDNIFLNSSSIESRSLEPKSWFYSNYEKDWYNRIYNDGNVFFNSWNENDINNESLDLKGWFSPNYKTDWHINAFQDANIFNQTIKREYHIDVIEKFSESSSSENFVNESREDYLRNKITPIFLNLIKEEQFEFGYKTPSEILLLEQLKINALATRNWLNEIYIKHFCDEKILVGILRILGRFSEQLIFPQGHTIALASLNHQSDEIKELGIRAFEKWGSEQSLSILKCVNSNTSWLQEYIDQVVKDLEEELMVK